MRVAQARRLFRQLTESYFTGATVVFSNQSRAAKQKQPLVVITTGNLNRPNAANYSVVDGVQVASYLSRLSITVDLWTNGSPVVDPDTGVKAAYENNALDDMMSFADFLNSQYTVNWSHSHDVAVLLDGDAIDMTGLVNDNNYEFRARLSVMFYFTQQAVDGSAVLGEDSIVYPTGEKDPETDEPVYTPVEPAETESTTGGYETDYIKKVEEATVKPTFGPTTSGGGNEELAQESTGYFSEAEIKEEKA